MDEELLSLLRADDIIELRAYYRRKGNLTTSKLPLTVTVLHVACTARDKHAVRWILRNRKDISVFSVSERMSCDNCCSVECGNATLRKTWPLACFFSFLAQLRGTEPEDQRECIMMLIEHGARVDVSIAPSNILKDQPKYGLDFMICYQDHIESVIKAWIIVSHIGLRSPVLRNADMGRLLARAIWSVRMCLMNDS